MSGSSRNDAAVMQTLQAAINDIGAGRLDEAAARLRADRAAMRTPVGQNILGDVYLKQERPDEALRAFEAALKIVPHMPEAHANRGVALQALGRLEEALAAQDRAIRERSDFAKAHFNRGNVLKEMAHGADAVAAYSKALAAQPVFPEARLNRGLARLDLGELIDASADFDAVLTQRPRSVAALVGRAGVARKAGDFARALATLDSAAAIDPNDVDVMLARTEILSEAERFDDALAAIREAVDRFPNDGRVLAAMAVALSRLHRGDEALAAAEAAARVAPKAKETYEALGIVMGELGRFAEGLAALDTAQNLGSSGAAYFHSRALMLSSLGRREEADAAFEQALALDPTDPTPRYDRALMHLATGDMARGWADHEARLAIPGRITETSKLAPQWRGEDLAGKRILIHHEQGAGDTIQFTRFVPLVAARGAVITLRVQESLRRLYEANFPDCDVISTLGMRAAFDYQISLMSLPFAFGTTLETIPQNVPYLAADPALVAKWKQRIGNDGLKVGIAWQGNPKYVRDHERSIPLAAFAPLAGVPGIRLISLQWTGSGTALPAMPEGMRVERLGEEIENNPDGFREVAAAMEALDVLVTSDTGPAHLAGALGRPIHVALARRPDWRWMTDGTTTPWYPTMHLHRQTASGDWAGVFGRIADDLRKLPQRA